MTIILSIILVWLGICTFECCLEAKKLRKENSLLKIKNKNQAKLILTLNRDMLKSSKTKELQ